MPEDTLRDAPGGASVPQDGSEKRPSVEGLLQSPSLADLLEALKPAAGEKAGALNPWVAAVRIARDARTPAERRAAEAFCAETLRAIRRELGDQAGELATRSLAGRSLTERTMEQILKTAVSTAAARRTALASAGLAPGGRPHPAARSAGAAQEPGRHPRLLDDCTELVRSNLPGLGDVRAVGEAAERLHDRVRGYLEKQGRWPIADARAYDDDARPAALMLLSWDDPAGR